jgi:hypothetical protein
MGDMTPKRERSPIMIQQAAKKVATSVAEVVVHSPAAEAEVIEKSAQALLHRFGDVVKLSKFAQTSADTTFRLEGPTMRLYEMAGHLLRMLDQSPGVQRLKEAVLIGSDGARNHLPRF